MSDTSLPEDAPAGAPPPPAPRRAVKLTFGDWMSALWGTWQRMDERNLGLIAAGVAFYAFLSLFPAISAVIAI